MKDEVLNHHPNGVGGSAPRAQRISEAFSDTSVQTARTPAEQITSCVDGGQSLAEMVLYFRDMLLGCSMPQTVCDGKDPPEFDGVLVQRANRAQYVEGRIRLAMEAVKQIENALDLTPS